MAKKFCHNIQDIQNSVDLKIHMAKLEKLLIQEMKTWWDLSTLQNYIEEGMIPIGIKIQRIPTLKCNDELIKDWEHILSNSSLKLIELIVAHE